jgi:hypothetical protein
VAAVTDARGRFETLHVPAGYYQVDASAPGHRTGGVTVSVDSDEQIALELESESAAVNEEE